MPALADSTDDPSARPFPLQVCLRSQARAKTEQVEATRGQHPYNCNKEGSVSYSDLQIKE